MMNRSITDIAPDEAKEAFRTFYDIREGENFFQFQFKNDYPPPNHLVIMSAIVGYETQIVNINNTGEVGFSGHISRRPDYSQRENLARMLEYLRGIGIVFDKPGEK